jgi:hypothetical protein
MLYNRYYDINTLLLDNTFSKSIDIMLVGNSKEVRAQRIASLFNGNFTGEVYSINYDVEFEKYSLIKSSLSLKSRVENLQSNGKDLLHSFINDLRNIGIDNKTILIDITSLSHPVVFYLINILKHKFSPQKLFICYTEPQKYDKIDSEEIEIKFDLTEKFCEVNSLPGFLRLSDHNKEKLLVTTLGFEGARFSKAFADVNPAPRKTYAIVGFPSFYPSWQYYVYSQNQSTLLQSKANDLIYRTTANEPFGVYNILNKIKSNNSNYEITIAPLGTKPHSLGVSMFAVKNEDVQLYYDFPSHGKKIRTVGIGKSFMYNLTSFINEK